VSLPSISRGDGLGVTGYGVQAILECHPPHEVIRVFFQRVFERKSLRLIFFCFPSLFLCRLDLVPPVVFSDLRVHSLDFRQSPSNFSVRCQLRSRVRRRKHWFRRASQGRCGLPSSSSFSAYSAYPLLPFCFCLLRLPLFHSPLFDERMSVSSFTRGQWRRRARFLLYSTRTFRDFLGSPHKRSGLFPLRVPFCTQPHLPFEEAPGSPIASRDPFP